MDCAKAQQLWHSRLDGELTPPEQASLEAHLQACDVCRAHCRQMEELTGALERLRQGSEMVGQGRAADRRGASPRPRWAEVWRVGRVAAVMALVVGAGVYFSWQRVSKVIPVGSPVPGPTAERSLADGSSVAQVVLSGGCAARFIPVARETGHPNVHVFVLYETFDEATP